MIIKNARRRWLKLFKLAATCKKCGYDNPYIDPDPNYVCRQCRKRQEMWGESGEPKARAPAQMPSASAPSAPNNLWTIFRRVREAMDQAGAYARYVRIDHRDPNNPNEAVYITNDKPPQGSWDISTNKKAAEAAIKVLKNLLGAPTRTAKHGTSQPVEIYHWDVDGGHISVGYRVYNGKFEIDAGIDTNVHPVNKDAPKDPKIP